MREGGGLRGSLVFFSLRGSVVGLGPAPMGIRLGSVLPRGRRRVSPDFRVVGASTK